jgi:2-polyprenyl-3-methyl-5-hydroxy-6-metoxy-1,4-benzoquinol methylase
MAEHEMAMRKNAAHDLSRRSIASEWMDIEPLGFDELRLCLQQLAQINLLSLGYRPTLAWFAKTVRRRSQGGPLSVLDVGCGYGDMLRQLRRWADRHQIAMDLHGVDINPITRQVALSATPPGFAIHYHTADIFDLPAEQTYDVVISSLFTHHLDDVALVRFLHWMTTHATLGWFINDLHRSALAYFGVKQFLRIMGYHRVVQHDGPVSVERALTLGDWHKVIDEAGLRPSAVTVRRFFPFRTGIGCYVT